MSPKQPSFSVKKRKLTNSRRIDKQYSAAWGVAVIYQVMPT